MGEKKIKMVTLTVTTSPTDATCTLTYDGQTYTTKSATVPEGTEVTYSVSKTEYQSQTGTINVKNDTILNVKLNIATYKPRLRVTGYSGEKTATITIGSKVYTKTSSGDSLLLIASTSYNSGTSVTYTFSTDAGYSGKNTHTLDASHKWFTVLLNSTGTKVVSTSWS